MWYWCGKNTHTHHTYHTIAQRYNIQIHTHLVAWKMVNVKKPHNNIITYPTASHRWWCVPKYHRCYTQIMYIPYTNNIKLPSHVRNVLFCGEKCCTIIFTLRLPRSLTGWLLDCCWTALAGCHSMWASPALGLVHANRRECVRWLVYCGFKVFCVYLIGRWNLIYVPKHRESNYHCASGTVNVCTSEFAA